MKLATSIILCLLLPATAAMAQENPYGEPGYWRRLHKEQRYAERHRYRAPRVKAWRRHHHPKPEPVITDHHALCLWDIKAHGTPHVTEQGALEAAKKHWQAVVRYEFGEKYLDITHAKNMRYRCARAETNETAAGRVAEAITGDAWRMRCEVVAKPCRTELRSGQ